MKTCKLKTCSNPHHAKGYCKNHYRKRFGLNKKRWEKVKHDPVLLEASKRARNAYYQKNKDEEWFKESKALSDSKYYRNNKEKISAYKKDWYNNSRFGGLREEVIESDGYKCAECSMSREEHYNLWDCDLHVDHKDGRGRAVSGEEKNNDKANLVTLCRSCHMKKGLKSGEIHK